MWLLMTTCYLLMAGAFATLALAGLQGYFQFTIFGAGHPHFALVTIILYLFAETLIMFFFIGRAGNEVTSSTERSRSGTPRSERANRSAHRRCQRICSSGTPSSRTRSTYSLPEIQQRCHHLLLLPRTLLTSHKKSISYY